MMMMKWLALLARICRDYLLEWLEQQVLWANSTGANANEATGGLNAVRRSTGSNGDNARQCWSQALLLNSGHCHLLIQSVILLNLPVVRELRRRPMNVELGRHHHHQHHQSKTDQTNTKWAPLFHDRHLRRATNEAERRDFDQPNWLGVRQ